METMVLCWLSWSGRVLDKDERESVRLCRAMLTGRPLSEIDRALRDRIGPPHDWQTRKSEMPPESGPMVKAIWNLQCRILQGLVQEAEPFINSLSQAESELAKRMNSHVVEWEKARRLHILKGLIVSVGAKEIERLVTRDMLESAERRYEREKYQKAIDLGFWPGSPNMSLSPAKRHQKDTSSIGGDGRSGA